MRELKPCGTFAAYKRHLLNREEPCDPCKRANTENGRPARRKHNRCRGRAYSRLASLYLDEFDVLLAEERAKDAGPGYPGRTRQRALRRLTKQFPATFSRLLHEEIARDGEPR